MERNISAIISEGKTFIGIEFGSTRIKSVLIDDAFNVLASGNFDWENKLEGGYWTYGKDEIIEGMQISYRNLAADVYEKYGVKLIKTAAIGISGMMHGYLAFDSEDNLLVPFRTWRNITTGVAAKKLSETLSFNIPKRWSISHLYQAILDKEPHVDKIDHINTLAGHIHYLLTGKKVVGIGEASGIFPLLGNGYNKEMLKKTEELFLASGYSLKLEKLLPSVKKTGETAGYLTERGAKLLDPTGTLQHGIPLCPPEGDASTGIVATNSIRPGTGNISAGTSIFATVVMKYLLPINNPEIDIMSTPDGYPTAVIHCGNCTGDIDAWMHIFQEVLKATGSSVEKSKLFETLMNKAMEADADLGGLMNFNYISGESITGIKPGVPLFLRQPGARFTLANFLQTHLFSALATLRIGMEYFFQEGVKFNRIICHGGFFHSQAGAKAMAAALDSPVYLYKTASLGGPWGMALLAAYSQSEESITLADYLDNKVFKNFELIQVLPDRDTVTSFVSFLEKYRKFLKVEADASRCFNE